MPARDCREPQARQPEVREHWLSTEHSRSSQHRRPPITPRSCDAARNAAPYDSSRYNYKIRADVLGPVGGSGARQPCLDPRHSLAGNAAPPPLGSQRAAWAETARHPVAEGNVHSHALIQTSPG